MRIVKSVLFLCALFTANVATAQCCNCNCSRGCNSSVTYQSTPTVTMGYPNSNMGEIVYQSGTYAAPVVYESSADTTANSYVSYETPVTYGSTVAYGNSYGNSYELPTYGTAASSVSYAPTSYVSTPNSYVSTATYQPSTTPMIAQASYQGAANAGSSDQMNVLMVVNQKRRRAGLPALTLDPNLASVAQRKSYYRANRRMTGHDGSNMGGGRVEGVGYSYGQSDPLSGFNTCYLYSTGYRYAGAAISYDANRRAYYTLLLR